MAIGDLLKIRIVTYRGTLAAANLGINVTHWSITAQTGAGVTLKEIATALDTTWAAAYKGLMSTGARYRGTGVQMISPTLSAEAIEIGNTGAGTVAADVLSSTTGLMRKRTGLGGRRNMGRLYVAFPAETDNDNNNAPSAGYLTQLLILNVAIGIGQTVIGGGGTATLQHVIYHRDTGTYTALTELTDETSWATQRRRQPRGKVRPVPF